MSHKSIAQQPPQTPYEIERDTAGKAIECGTLDVFCKFLHLQSVMVMPLTRTIQRNSVTAQQYVIHVTAYGSASMPIYYATLRAAEIDRSSLGTILSAPYLVQAPYQTLQHEAERLHHELQIAVITYLKNDPHVSNIIAPARVRLPDMWVWQANCTAKRIICQQCSWQLLDVREKADSSAEEHVS